MAGGGSAVIDQVRTDWGAKNSADTAQFLDRLFQQHGHWMMALSTGHLPPLNAAHEAFIEVAQGKRSPVSVHERAWFKYLGRTKLEAEKGEALKIEYHVLEDSFYSRDMAKQLRRSMRATISEAHRTV